MMLYRVSLALRPLGWDSKIVCLNGGGAVAERLAAAGMEVVRLDIKGFISLCSGFVRLVKLIRAWRPQVVHTWLYRADLVGGLAAWIARVDCIIWSIRNSRLRVSGGMLRKLLPRMCGLMSYLLPDRIVSCARAGKDVHVSEFGYKRSRIVVIPNGYDDDYFQRSEDGGRHIRREYGIGEDEQVIGVVGRFDINKGHEVLMEAIRRLQTEQIQARVLLVGAGIDAANSELTKMVERCGLGSTVILAGQHDNMPAIYSAMDMLVSSSVSEGFPNVVAEAMLCERAIVATDVGDTREVVGPCGSLVGPNDAVALARAIGAMLKMDASARGELGRKARARIVGRYGIDAAAGQYALVYGRCQ
jgi:glycosyltransferase involved in cell wall biosynthesis